MEQQSPGEEDHFKKYTRQEIAAKDHEELVARSTRADEAKFVQDPKEAEHMAHEMDDHKETEIEEADKADAEAFRIADLGRSQIARGERLHWTPEGEEMRTRHKEASSAASEARSEAEKAGGAASQEYRRQHGLEDDKTVE